MWGPAPIFSLVVDDGSEDATPRIAESFGGRVRLVRKSHGGLASTRNAGLRASQGHYIVFLDADDLLEPQLVERAVRFLQHRPELAFVFANLRFFHSEGPLSPPFIPPRLFGGEESVLHDPLGQVLLAGFSIAPSGLCAGKQALVEAGFFDESLWGAEDLEYFSRLYLRRPVGYIDLPLVRLRRHAGNMTNQAARMIPSIASALAMVEASCLRAGRGDLAATARRYGRRAMLRAARGVLVGGQRSDVRRLLLEHRGRLLGPEWALMLVATWAPPVLPRALARVKRWLGGRKY
jgi:glycosyltransferase involved in cell wall biosynthesis